MICQADNAPQDDDRKPSVYELFGLDADERLTVNAARAQLAPAVMDGARCPCCTQLVRVYPRKLNSAMAATLLFIVKTSRATGERFVHIGERAPRYALRGKDFALMVHWGLIEPGEPIDGHASGWWAATKDGAAFADRSIRVRSHALIGLGARFFGLSGVLVNIDEALDEQFDYWELLRS